MLDNLDPKEGRTNQPTSRETPAARPLADREVPLAGRNTAAIHAWLDGDLPESAVRQGDTARDVEFWLRIERDVEVRRTMKTPVHVYQQIMDSLPATAPQARWWRRQLTINPMLALVAAAGAIAIGMAIGAALLHGR